MTIVSNTVVLFFMYRTFVNVSKAIVSFSNGVGIMVLVPPSMSPTLDTMARLS